MKKTIYGFIIAGISLGSCNKIDSIPTRFTPTPATNTNIKFLMLSPDAPQINFFGSNIKLSGISPSATNAVQGLTYPAIFPANVGYATLPSGSVKIEAKVIDSSTVTPGAIIYTSTQNFDAQKFYTYALLDSVNKITSVVVQDDPSVPDATKAYIRIANFTSNNNNVKVEIIKTSAGAAFSKVYTPDFKSVSAYEPLEAGNGAVYKVYLKNPTTDAKLDSISSFSPSMTKKYTIYSRGVFGLNGTNTKRPIISSYVNF